MGMFSSSQTQNSSSTNDSTSHGNLADNPAYQQFLAGYGNIANSGISDIATPTNPYGNQAGAAQAGVADNLNPAYGAAGSAAAGTTYNADSYRPYMSAYTNDVTNAIRDQFGTTMKQANETIGGNLAAQGALGNSNNAVARANALAPIANAENTAIAQNIQQGFNQANQNAQTAGQFQLSGANTLGSLANANTGANSALANIGQGLFGNQISAQEFPAQLAQLFNQGWLSNNGIAGTTSHSTGNGTSTTTSSPSLFSDIMGTVGMVAGMFKDGGAIPSYYADGGAVIDLDPVLLAHLIKGMPPAFSGKFAEGGGVDDDARPVSLKELPLRPYVSLLEDLERNGPRSFPVNHGEIKPNTDWVLEKFGLPGARAADAMESVGDFGKAIALQPFHAGESVADAMEHPSLGSITNAGAQTAMAAFRPLTAAKVLGAGYGAGLAGSALERMPSLTSSANAEGNDPLDVRSRARMTALQKKQTKGESLTRAEREEQNSYLDIMAGAQKAQAEAAAEAERIKQSGLASVEAKRMADEAELDRQKKQAAKGEYDSAVVRAEGAKAKALGADTRYSDSWLRDVYEKTGGVPGLTLALAGGVGGLDRLAKGPIKSWSDGLRVAGEGAGAGLLAYNGPLAYDTFGAPARNPEKEAYLGYARDLPEGHPLKEWAAKYASTLPDANPTRTTAADEFYDWGKAAKRTLAGGAEGALSALTGHNVPKAAVAAARGTGALVGDAAEGTAATLGGLPTKMQEGYWKNAGRAASAKEDALTLQQNASDAGRSAAAARADALAARDDLAEAVRRSSAREAAVDQPVSPLPVRPSASDRNSGQASGAPSVGATDTAIALPNRQEIMDELAAIRQGVEAQKVKAAAGVPDPVKREAIPAPKSPSYVGKYKKVGGPYVASEVDAGREIPATQMLMKQFDDAGLARPSTKTAHERLTNAETLLGKIRSFNPGISDADAAKMLGSMMANPKKLPSDWGLPKEFILPAVAAPVIGSAMSDKQEGHADGGMVSPETHALPEDHSWDHRGVGSKVRAPDGSFAPMSVAQRKNGGAAPDPVRYKRTYATGGVVIGPVMGTTGGRTDAKPVSVPANAYVIPADVVSAVPGAEGNTLAGMEKLKQIFGSGNAGYAAGGTTHKPVPILISDGEYVVPPEVVAMHGGGDVKQGHRILDAFVKKLRSANIKKLQKLPAPAR